MAILAALFLSACSGKTPIKKITEELDVYPEFSIILNDMRADGNFSTTYYHEYKLVYAEQHGDSLVYRTQMSDWYRVSKREFSKYANMLGMTIVSKQQDGEISNVQYPPGYQYVGDTRYGRWRSDSSGRSFWAFYGQYHFMRSMFYGYGGSPIYRNDYDAYRTSYRSRRPYYGLNNQYGTSGRVTQQNNRNFYQRRAAREKSRKQRFNDKVRQRSSRSRMSRVRSRSSRGFGK